MKILVGLSGGVDSSVAAALLCEAGHDVAAFTLILGQSNPDGVQRCCAPNDLRDARAVADRLGIAHYVWDFKELFRDQVYRPFLAGYSGGVTPNPCGMCNREVRFGAVLDRVTRLGFDALATGHYARSENGGLYRALDRQKDQAYFLSRIRREAFDQILFPLAYLTKSRVRQIAADLGLETREKPESQEICFVSGKTSDFLASRIDPRPGDIVDRAGNVLGRHSGVHLFTLGQRRGIGISSPRPLYVTAIDAGSRRVTVGPREEAFLSRVRLTNCNVLSPEILDSRDLALSAQFRYHAATTGVKLTRRADTDIDLDLTAPAFAPASGQIGVLYDGDRVVASGLIAA
ncbi:tRNA 2-thiouridine(34) synthase MnmA [bacterium]|nr:tRNA 2-thiouridine(34) synthase MnmA [bacterium]